MGVNGIPQQLTGMIDRFSQTRTGVVTLVDPQYVTVTVAETSIRAAYIRQAEPEIGDVVAVLRQGASWFVLGTSSTSGGNQVINPSFEDGEAGNVPDHWIRYNISGTSAVSSTVDPKAVDGTRILYVSSRAASTATSYVYSEPIAVASGQQWELSAYVWASYSPGSTVDTSDPAIYALWFANTTDPYPTTSSADTSVVAISNLTEQEEPVVMRGTVTVPASPLFMRVALRSAATAYSTLQYDMVTARRVV